MKIVHALGWYFPDNIGGTEVYVKGLAAELSKCGIDNVITAPLEGWEEKNYIYDGIPVYRYPLHPDDRRETVYTRRPRGGHEFFQRWLEKQKPDVFHQHSWTAGCGFYQMQAAKRLGIPTVRTVHLIGCICMRGSMMLYGKKPCDGKFDLRRCGTCWCMSTNTPRFISEKLASLSPKIALLAKRWLPYCRLKTALSVPEVMNMFWQDFRNMVDLSDRLVMVSRWPYEVMLRNDVPEGRLRLCYEGIEEKKKSALRAHKDGVLKICFLGRWFPVKGIHIIVKAVRNLPSDLPVELYVYGISQGDEHQNYKNRVLSVSNRDSRIHIEKPLPAEEISERLAQMDILAVPSQWFETGPLVILEAFMAGIPVLGSDLGGIKELITHGVNGWLLPHDDVSAWSAAIRKLIENPAILENFRQGIPRVRSTRDIAEEMIPIYGEILR